MRGQAPPRSPHWFRKAHFPAGDGADARLPGRRDGDSGRPAPGSRWSRTTRRSSTPSRPVCAPRDSSCRPRATGRPPSTPPRAWRPDLLILDVVLPGFDELGVMQSVQAQRAVPMVMLTARDDGGRHAGRTRGSAPGTTWRKPLLHAWTGRAGACAAAPRSSGPPIAASTPRLRHPAAGRAGDRPRSAAGAGALRGRASHAHRVRPARLSRPTRPTPVLSREQLLAEVWDWAGKAPAPAPSTATSRRCAGKISARTDPYGARGRLRAGDTDAMNRGRTGRTEEPRGRVLGRRPSVLDEERRAGCSGRRTLGADHHRSVDDRGAHQDGALASSRSSR